MLLLLILNKTREPFPRNPKTAKPVPADMMTAELAGILLAGHEALGHSLAWALYLLAANKDVQVRRELGGSAATTVNHRTYCPFLPGGSLWPV
jgi:cytochrome P450